MFASKSASNGSRGVTPSNGSDIYTRTSTAAETTFTTVTKSLTQQAKILRVVLTAVNGPAFIQIGPFADGRSIYKEAVPNQAVSTEIDMAGLPEFAGVVPSLTFGTMLPGAVGSVANVIIEWLKPKA